MRGYTPANDHMNASMLMINALKNVFNTQNKICRICGKAFIGSGGVAKHMVVHTGEKAFTCEYCAKSFNRRSTLRVHIKIHTGEKPHVCELCGKGFIQAHCLRSHLQNHSTDGLQQQPVLEDPLQVVGHS